MTNKIFVTGRPGVGKTTLVFKVSNELKKRGLSVGGIVTLEVRIGGVRTGFKIIDVQSGAEARLASVSSAVGPRVGKYLVHVENLDAFASTSILRALEQCDLVVVDEIGPMELKSQKFIDVVKKALASEKPLLATLHHRLKHPLLDYIRSQKDFEIVELTPSNRDTLLNAIVGKLLRALGRAA